MGLRRRTGTRRKILQWVGLDWSSRDSEQPPLGDFFYYLTLEIPPASSLPSPRAAELHTYIHYLSLSYVIVGGADTMYS